MNIINRIANKIVRHTRWYDSFWGGATKFWHINKFNIDVVNLGSNSGKYAFTYEGLNIEGQNWAIGPQSLVHDFNILKNYFSYLKNGAYVLIPICPFSCLVSNYTKASNLKYYTFLHPATIINFDETERIKALTIRQNPFSTMPVDCTKRTIKEILKLCLPKKNSNTAFKDNSDEFIEMWKHQFDIKDLDAKMSEKHRNDKKKRSKLLNEMILFCKERNLNPIIVMPPIHPSLTKKLSPEFRENYIDSFVHDATNGEIPFFNYMDDEVFGKDEYFMTSYFMNEKGAKRFTKAVMKRIKLV